MQKQIQQNLKQLVDWGVLSKQQAIEIYKEYLYGQQETEVWIEFPYQIPQPLKETA